MSRATATTETPRRVLIIKPSSLGDVVTALAVLRGLRRSFPDASISWLIRPDCAQLVRHDTDLDEVILFDRARLGRAWRSPTAAVGLAKLLIELRTRAFDWVLDLQGLLRSGLLCAFTAATVRAGFADAREGGALFYTHRVRPAASHTVDRNIELARALGIDATGQDMTLQVSPAGESYAARLCEEHGLTPGRFVVCVPPTRWATKRYPPLLWRKVITSLLQRVGVVVLGGPGDKWFCGQITEALGDGLVDLTGKTSVEQMAGVIAASGGVICSDSAAKFIAQAFGVDVVCLIGPTRPELTGPYRSGTAVIADVPCQGCLKKRCRHTTCMQVIDPADVLEAAESLGAIRSS